MELERRESDWPVGLYGLLSTSTGCPESENHGWTTTFINLTYVGNNSSDGRQTWTNNLPLLGPYHYRTIQLNLCVRMEDEGGGGKIVEAGNVSRPTWPRGSYCLVKVVPGDCPTDFRYDAMTLANYAVTTTDRDAAILVDFSADTLSFSLGLCCRDDEDPNNAFHLPTSSAFLLLQVCPRYEHQCLDLLCLLIYG
ncbi:uncharacterized protein LOC124137410 [Haliotis rufescens]|uniref:uncharacterized protein LOC124137410 n=1 Tax=Haliotis rufescens TaxID=6454 RepID=UPI00201EB09A|nr:uncharacterized protein LOC124137410 [Haliotis rufescens]